MADESIHQIFRSAQSSIALGKYTDARGLLVHACKLDPHNSEIWYLRGDIERVLGRYKEADKCYMKVLSIYPNNANAHHGLAESLAQQNRIEDAVMHYREALRQQPNNHTFWNNFGVTLQNAGNDLQATHAYQRVIEIKPDHHVASYNLALLLRKQGRLNEAEKWLNHVLSLAPKYVQAWLSLGHLQYWLGRYDEAIESYENGLEIDSSNADLHYNHSQALLITGQLTEGWKEFAWHYRVSTSNWPDIPVPLWRGSLITEKTLLVHYEQGIGDQIMMMSLIPELAAKAEHLIVECDPRLAPLVERSFPGVTARPDRYHEPGNNAGLDLYAPASSVIQYLRTDTSSFPDHQGYLQADNRKTSFWRELFTAFGDNLKVGISWRGGANDVNKRMHRSIGLELWVPLLSTPGASFVSLQYGVNSDMIHRFNEDYGVNLHYYDESNPINDLDGFAAQIAALDLVISIDNSTVHMSGALAVNTWVMLPCYPDWRWLLCIDSSYWYPSLRLFRQPEPGEWGVVLSRVKSQLNEYIKCKNNSAKPA